MTVEQHLMAINILTKNNLIYIDKSNYPLIELREIYKNYQKMFKVLCYKTKLGKQVLENMNEINRLFELYSK